MNETGTDISDTLLEQRLAGSGLRATPQRQHVYSVLLRELDHPTADQVFLRAKQAMPEISMATVYNCLDAIVKCGLVRQVNSERAATRYCPNMHEHCHFYCDECGHVYDIDFSSSEHLQGLKIPVGFQPIQIDASVRGLCRDCRDNTAASNTAI